MVYRIVCFIVSLIIVITLLVKHEQIMSRNKHALIVTGELRFDSFDQLHKFKETFHNASLFVCTYSRFENIAYMISQNVLLIDDIPQPAKIPSVAANQFYFLQLALNHFDFHTFQYIGRLRTDAIYKCNFTLNHFPADGIVYMETDHCYYANAATFLKTFKNIYDTMNERKYYNYKEEKRTMLPNFQNILESDLSRHDQCGWCTRWEWLEFPKNIFTQSDSPNYDELKPLIRTNLLYLMYLHTNKIDIETTRLSTLPPVSIFCAESSFIHHVLENAAIRPFEVKTCNVRILSRESRCPMKIKCIS